MSKFNVYAERANQIANAAFEEAIEKEKAYKEAENRYQKYRILPRDMMKASAEEKARAARAEADCQAAKKDLDSFNARTPERVGREMAEIKKSLEAAISKHYSADPAALDSATVELLKSGMLKTSDYARLIDDANKSGNMTMVRMIANHAGEKAVEADKKGDRDNARELRNIANMASTASGSEYIKAFDGLAEVLDRCLRNPSLRSFWEQKASSIIRDF